MPFSDLLDGIFRDAQTIFVLWIYVFYLQRLCAQ